VFFPTGDPTVLSLLVTFGAFGLAYVVRPLGAIVVGGYTDRAGRKAGLLLSMALMMIGTTLMAVTPGYATIGLAAPIIITLPARQLLVRQDGAPVDHGDHVLAVRADRISGLLPDGRLAVAGSLRTCCWLAPTGQSRKQRCSALAEVRAVPGRNPGDRRVLEL
jgi:Sugar (and other) transporter